MITSAPSQEKVRDEGKGHNPFEILNFAFKEMYTRRQMASAPCEHLTIETFQFNDFSENTYLIYTPGRDGVIVDVGCRSKREWEGLRDFVRGANIRITGLLNTHAHLDHIFGVEFARKEWGAPLYLHPADEPLLADAPSLARAWGVNMPPVGPPDRPLHDGQMLEINGHPIRVIHTPGHSAGGVCFYLESASALFCGDTLFARSVGRTDLLGGDFNTLIQSILQKLMVLPNDTVILPGHGPLSTIGDEREFNPFLS